MCISSCAITGHRPTRFKFKYREDYSLCKKIKRSLTAQIEKAYQDGARTFYVGGALGVDMWAGEIIAELKAKSEYADVHLICALPFDGYDKQWDDKSRKRLGRILSACDGAVKVSEAESPDAYKIRNYYMVDHADRLIAVFDHEHTPRSGTSQTVNYAKKRGMSITYIHPDTATVSEE
ncbi:MAG: SLOG family protein [Clostridiaceae bacterium]|jgi:uncharacterized phage-like protein YoqJ|nr:SLOG family protein [Clostridiaceae bacterium]